MSFNKSTVFLAAALLALALPRAARAQAVDAGSRTIPARGPLPTRNSETINSLFLLPVPTMGGGVLAKSRSRLDFDAATPNTFSIRPEAGYSAHYEEQRLTLGYVRGLGNGQEVALRVPYIARDGGVISQLINDWHHFFHIYGTQRQFYPTHEVHFTVRDAVSGKTLIDTRAGASGLGDVTLEYRRAIAAGDPGFDKDGTPDARRATLSVRVLLKLPTGSTRDLFGSGAADIGVGVSGSLRPLRRIALHGNLSAVYDGKSRIDGLVHRRSSVQSLLAIEWLLDGGTSFVVQSDDSPAPHRTGALYVDRVRRQFTFGFWHQITRNESVYLAGGENDFGFAAKQAPDYTVDLGTRFAL